MRPPPLERALVSLVSLARAVCVLCCVEGRVQAGGGAATDAYEEIRRGTVLDVHALADLYLQGSFNAPLSNTAQLRSFDTRTTLPALGLLRVTAAHAPDPFGFRLDVGVGDLPDAYLHFDPAQTAHPEVSRAFSYIEQGFVTVTLPVGRGLRLDAGKLETPVGLEDNEALENWSYSRSLLYLLAEPSYHTGVRLTYRPVETLALSALAENGWDVNVLDGNGMRSFGAAATWSPSAKLEIVGDYMGGAERPLNRLSDPTLSYRSVFDAYARYALSERVSFACTADYGHDAANGGVSWGGIGGYVRVKMVDWLAGSVRGEHYEDPDGFTSGAKQRLAEVTATLEARDHLGPFALISRLEYRRDQSDARVFEAGGTRGTRFTPRQDTLSLSLLAAF